METTQYMNATADMGLIGLGVMGENLVLNVESRGFTAAVYNRTAEKVDAFIQGRGAGKRFVGCHSLKDFVASLKRPRRVMILVKAGKPVDDVIASLLPLLEQGDIIIDGGNSYWPDTTRRCRDLTAKGILYVGSGVSGGEEGALKGPSMMPGGNPAAWPHIQPIFQAIAAKVNETEVACDWVGDEGAGHFIKMVHNGIEYGDMQIICEAYHVMREVLGMTAPEIGDVFAEWNKGELASYLIEITASIFIMKDPSGGYVVDKILDVAGQKGTGRWTVVDGLEVGEPITLIAEAVFARNISALKEERLAAASVLKPALNRHAVERAQTLAALKDAVLAAKILSYTQGFAMIDAMAKAQGWQINKGAVALMWRAGCIIRSVFLGNIRDAFDRNPELKSLLLDPWFTERIHRTQAGLRRVLKEGITAGIPLPAMSTSLAYFDGYRSAELPANLLQAQRDYFGAHTYERIDGPRGVFHHTNWTGEGGSTTSSSYNA
jgi:6-phosphogluconate dehydrogenase